MLHPSTYHATGQQPVTIATIATAAEDVRDAQNKRMRRCSTPSRRRKWTILRPRSNRTVVEESPTVTYGSARVAASAISRTDSCATNAVREVWDTSSCSVASSRVSLKNLYWHSVETGHCVQPAWSDPPLPPASPIMRNHRRSRSTTRMLQARATRRHPLLRGTQVGTLSTSVSTSL